MESANDQPLSLASPRSHCPDCGTQLKALHNIPILSYCFLRGRCSNCGSLISVQYPLIELLSAFVTAYILTVHGISEKALFSLIFTYSLIVLAVIDMREQILPDQITLPLVWVGLIASILGIGPTLLQQLMALAWAIYPCGLLCTFLNGLLVKKVWVMVTLNSMPLLVHGLAGKWCQR